MVDAMNSSGEEESETTVNGEKGSLGNRTYHEYNWEDYQSSLEFCCQLPYWGGIV